MCAGGPRPAVCYQIVTKTSAKQAKINELHKMNSSLSYGWKRDLVEFFFRKKTGDLIFEDCLVQPLLPTTSNVLARYLDRRPLTNGHHTESLSDCGPEALCNTKARCFRGNVRRAVR